MSTMLLLLALGQAKTPTDAEIVARGKGATLLVELGAGRGYGSAFCIDDRGFYLTNGHVVGEPGSQVTVIFQPSEKTQKKLRAKVLKKDAELDLALLKLGDDAKHVSLKLGSDEGLLETSEVIAFGFPFGTGLAATEGEYPSVSVNKGRITALRKKDGILSRVQIDAILNPGNSGGPVLDRKGEVMGVVVSGIMGAGAVNFAIPVSHTRKFLEQPALALTVPDFTGASLGEPVEFKATVSPSPLAVGAFELRLIISGAGPERRFDMKLAGNIYTVKAVPFPGRKDPGLRLTAIFADGSISGVADDGDLQVGTRTVRLKDVSTVQTAPPGTVLLQNGETLTGAIKKLGVIAINVGGQSVQVNLAPAAELAVASNESAVSLTFTVVAMSGSKEVARTEAKYEVEGSAPGAGGAPAAPAGGAGVASVEELIEGRFNRPGTSGPKSTYLKVLSTSGDYIGQGKRYEYDAKALAEIRPADGLVSLRVDGWNLEITPGMGKIFKVGTYENARRYPFNDAQPGLNFSGNGRGSNTLEGKFVVWEFGVQGGKVTRLAIDFVQFSEGKKAAPLVGMLRYNSSFR